MSNVVFILGAGASKQCGAPLMANFLDVANNLLRSNRVDEKAYEFKQVFSAIGGLQAVHSKAQLDLNNIESIFTVLELGRVIQKVPGLGSIEAIEATIAALKELIVKTLEITIDFPVINKNEIGVPKPYGTFGEMLKYLRNDAFPRQTVAVISFNYDVAADMALYKSDLGPDYIIDKSDSNGSVPLLKLHGSLNWATDTVTGSKKIYPLQLKEYFNIYKSFIISNKHQHFPNSVVQVPIGSSLNEYFSQHRSNLPPLQVANQPVIVPPSWNKADYHSALSEVWAAAAQHLSEAEHIFIIGYSLPETDSFFRHLYALGSVGSAPLRRIAVFNPDDSGTTKQRFEALLGPGARARYEYHPLTFEDAIPHIRKLFPGRN